MNLSGGAARYREIAARCEDSLALDCARAGAKEYLAALDVTTPVLTGALRASEHIDAVFGSGTHATAVVAPHIIYAAFRNNGGTIHVRNKKVLSNGSRFFGTHVTQAGAHYMEKAEGESEGTMPAAMKIIVSEYFTL